MLSSLAATLTLIPQKRLHKRATDGRYRLMKPAMWSLMHQLQRVLSNSLLRCSASGAAGTSLVWHHGERLQVAMMSSKSSRNIRHKKYAADKVLLASGYPSILGS